MRTGIAIGLCFFAVGLIAGCAGNPYAKYYHGNSDGRTIVNYVPPTGPLEIYSTNDLPKDRDILEQKGYMPFGYSSFNAGANSVSEGQLKKQAAKIGATAVLVSSHYSNTVTGAVPVPIPSVSTTRVSGSFGSATATTYGADTVVIPYSVQHNDFTAVYFVKMKFKVGVMFGVIDAQTRSRLQTNAGVLVKTVVSGSPAFRADIFPGDVILMIDGQRVDGSDGFKDLVTPRLGQQVVFDIDRNGARVEKAVTLPSP